MTDADHFFMKLAIEQAERAFDADEVPIGAIVVTPDGILAGEGYNQPISTNDPTAHAEIIALRDAASFSRNYRLTGFTLYVTLEPCIMCFGAMIQARIGRLVFGAPDTRTGVTKQTDFITAMNLNHSVHIEGAFLEQECSQLLSRFFQLRRQT